ncbi:MAG TPA: glycosyltransferase family 1 protein [Gemmatimonadales bacterium]|nr:glycosyltransferase family 1 protein [Gemmatimonadales bacterium]
MSRIYVNGRFLSQQTTGVQRFAREIISAIDTLLVSEESARKLSLVLLTPSGTEPIAGLHAIESRSVGKLQGQAWEQLELPRYTRDGFSLNLCNTAPLAGRSTIVAIHDAGVFAVPAAYSRPFRIWYRLLHARLGRHAAYMLTVSDFSRRELSRYLRVARERFAVIPNGGEHIVREPPDQRILQRLGLTGRYLLAVSSHSLHKNFAGIQAAVKHMRNQDFTLVFAGGANPRIFNAGQTSAGESMVTGRVTDAELRALYENAECFIYPSFYEGFGLPPLEAMTCGCPVVVSRSAALPEVCGDAAVYCDPNDPADIGRALDEVLENAELRSELRRRGKERAAQFTWKRSGTALVGLLDSLPTR